FQGLSSAEPLVRAHAQEALEAVRSPILARRVAELLAPNRHARPATLMPDALAIGAGDWRCALIAAATGEEPNLPRPLCPMDDLPQRRDGTMLSLVERATLLRGVPPFADLSSEQL